MRTALLSLALTVFGCGFQYADAPVVPSDIDPQPPEAVLVAAASTAAVWTGKGFCSSVLIGGNAALTDRHCYDYPDHDGGFGFVAAPGPVEVVRASQWDVGRDAVLLELAADLGDGVAVAEDVLPRGESVWTVGYGCYGMERALLHGGTVTGYIHNSLQASVNPGICPGDSGGPMLNARGEVVALTGGYYGDTDQRGIYGAVVAGQP